MRRLASRANLASLSLPARVVTKDFRQLWIYFAALWAVLALFWVLPGPNFGPLSTLPTYVFGLFLQFVAVPGVVAVIFQQDHPLRRDAVLRTRPFPPRQVLLGKGLTVLVGVILPAVVLESTLALRAGLSWDALPTIWVSAGLWISWIALLAAVTAVLTPSLARFAIAYGVLLLCVSASQEVAASYFKSTYPFLFDGGSDQPRWWFLPGLVLLCAFASASLMAAFSWNRHRARRRIAGLLVCGVALAAPAMYSWPWIHSSWSTRGPVRAEQIVLTGNAYRYHPGICGGPGDTELCTTLTGNARVLDLPEGALWAVD